MQYWYFNNQFSTNVIKEFNKVIEDNLIDIDNSGQAEGSIKTSIVKGVRYGDVKYFMNPIFDKCQITNIENQGLNIWHPTSYNLLNYNVYNEGSEYTWHMDGVSHFKYDMKYTVIINLSEEPYEGGEFDLFMDGAEEIEQMNVPGNFIMFNSQMSHRVRPVIKGQRKTLTYWMIGPKFV